MMLRSCFDEHNHVFSAPQQQRTPIICCQHRMAGFAEMAKPEMIKPT
jgi:hypothetical protein